MISCCIAGSSRELERCEAAIALARSLGLTVTCDWPAMIRACADPSPEEVWARAMLELRGIHDCDVLILLASHNESEARVELGAALALAKAVVVSTERGRARFFDALVSHVAATDEDAVRWAVMVGRAMEAAT